MIEHAPAGHDGGTRRGTCPRRVDRTARAARARGVTLLEIVVALAILGMLIVLAVPSYAEWLAETEAANTARQLAQSLMLARSEAIKHGGRVNLCKTAGSGRCSASGGWEKGWLVFNDDDGSGQVGGAEAIVRAEAPAPRGVTARANQPLANYVSFTSLGHARLLNGGLQMGTFTVCRPGSRAYQVVLAHSGRVRVEKSAERCP